MLCFKASPIYLMVSNWKHMNFRSKITCQPVLFQYCTEGVDTMPPFQCWNWIHSSDFQQLYHFECTKSLAGIGVTKSRINLLVEGLQTL